MKTDKIEEAIFLCANYAERGVSEAADAELEAIMAEVAALKARIAALEERNRKAVEWLESDRPMGFIRGEAVRILKGDIK